MSERPAIYKCMNVIYVSINQHKVTYTPPTEYKVNMPSLGQEHVSKSNVVKLNQDSMLDK